MNSKSAVVPRLLADANTAWTVLTVIGGVLTLSLLAQLKFYLPWSPVPITGQTFGVTLLALNFGRRLGSITTFTYILLGFMGLPVFAAPQAAWSVGPSIGYFVGMIFSALLIGWFADRGYASRFSSAALVGFAGSLLVLSCGALGLAFFVPTNQIMMAGVLPFLPGDIIKTLTAAALSSFAAKRA